MRDQKHANSLDYGVASQIIKYDIDYNTKPKHAYSLDYAVAS